MQFSARKLGYGCLRADVLVAILAALLASCGGGSSRNTAAPLLAGDAAASAANTLPRQDAAGVAPQDIVQHRLLTRLYVVLDASATVAEFNAAAGVVGATAIATSRTGSPFLTLTVPRQAGIGALNRLARTLNAQPGIAFADAATEFKASVLPDFAVPSGGSQFDHLLAARFPGAWNFQGRVEDCLPRVVPVIVVDKFGAPALRPEFFTQLDSRNFINDPRQSEVSSVDPEAGHGYDVSLVLAAKFDSTAPIGAVPFPDCVEIHQVEIAASRDMSEVLENLADVASQMADQRFIINASINFPDPLCGTNADQPCTETTLAQTPPDLRKGVLLGRVHRAIQWATRASEPGQEFLSRSLLAVSAGNKDSASPGILVVNAYPGFRDANWSNPLSLAAILGNVSFQLTDPDLWNSASNPAFPSFALSSTDVATEVDSPGLDALVSRSADLAFTTLTVGSVSSTADRSAATQSAFSFDNARLLASGEDVVLDSVGEADSGASYSAPQVAGLAALLWVHSDTLRNAPPGDTAQFIRTNATVLPGTGLSRRLIDAYQSVLGLDVPGSSQPMRRALLDFDNDGHFSNIDLDFFSSEFGPDDSPGPGLPDFRRSDLNGDGYRGGPRRDRFDLDITGNSLLAAAEFATVVQSIEGQEFHFDEELLTDLEILCYYAYSGLFEGTAEFRRETLGIDRCLGIEAEVSFPANVPDNVNTLITIHVTKRESGTGQRVDAGGVFVNLEILAGATAIPGFGTTGPNGTFTAAVTPQIGASEIRIRAEVRAEQGSPVLATTEIVAAVSGGQPVDRSGLYLGTKVDLCPECGGFGHVSGVGIIIRQTGNVVELREFDYFEGFPPPPFFSQYRGTLTSDTLVAPSTGDPLNRILNGVFAGPSLTPGTTFTGSWNEDVNNPDQSHVDHYSFEVVLQ